ncbi:hypothetical protein K2Q16_00125 [Patescibacteria group bacterium]|nr:hypothetical protein [Patescibacteria group bacterium]
MTTNTPEGIPDEIRAAAEKKRKVLNFLAIFGFLAMIVMVAILAVIAVRLLPTAFSSLANLAETINGRGGDRTIVVNADKTDLVSGDEVTLTWEAAPLPGSYTFSYECVDGVAVEIRRDDTTRAVRCDTVYSLGETNEVRLFITSEKLASTSIPYTITFLRTNDTSPRASVDGTLAIAREGDEDTPGAPEAPEEDVAAVPPPAPAPAEPAPAAPRPSTPRTEYYSYIPTSNPNGTTDLRVTFIEMGVTKGNELLGRSTFTGSNENFFRFEVRNVGTKTSEEWSYTATLPGDADFKRDDQKELKPNERAVITVRFPVEKRSGSEQVRITVKANNERVSSNNTLTWSANVR